MLRRLILAALSAVLSVFVALEVKAQQAQYTISHVAGDVYEYSLRSRGTSTSC